jgi:outer membrane lipoprotein SlyB
VANPQQGDRNGNAIGDACDRSLPPCSAGWSFTDPKVYGSIGGAVLGGVLIGVAGGGEAPTANTLTPTANPNPNPTPAPNPNPAPAPAPTPEPTPAPPPPPPRTTADGIYRCVEVVVVSDEGRHNGTIALGPQLTGNFDVREGSISIRHPAPFVDIVGAQFDTASGAFSGTAVGPVAGSPTVGVRADGTVTTSTGRIVFNYAMGTGGELPGGRPIVYRITLQKQ